MKPLFDNVNLHFGEPRESKHPDERMNWTLRYIKERFPTGRFTEPVILPKTDYSTLND